MIIFSIKAALNENRNIIGTFQEDYQREVNSTWSGLTIFLISTLSLQYFELFYVQNSIGFSFWIRSLAKPGDTLWKRPRPDPETEYLQNTGMSLTALAIQLVNELILIWNKFCSLILWCKQQLSWAFVMQSAGNTVNTTMLVKL